MSPPSGGHLDEGKILQEFGQQYTINSGQYLLLKKDIQSLQRESDLRIL